MEARYPCEQQERQGCAQGLHLSALDLTCECVMQPIWEVLVLCCSTDGTYSNLRLKDSFIFWHAISNDVFCVLLTKFPCDE